MQENTVRRWMSDECWAVMEPALEAAVSGQALQGRQTSDAE